MINVDFTTSVSGNNYYITDISTNTTGYINKRAVITALDGTEIFNSGTLPASDNPIIAPITGDWTTHMAVASITIELTYGTETGENVGNGHGYSLPTTLNIKNG